MANQFVIEPMTAFCHIWQSSKLLVWRFVPFYYSVLFFGIALMGLFIFYDGKV